MAEILWYGTDDDHTLFLTWLLAEPGLELWQDYSDFDQKLKRFKTPKDAIAEINRLYPNGRPYHSKMHLYLAGSGPRFRPTRYALAPSTGYSFRYNVTGGLGLMDLHLGPLHKKAIFRSRFQSPAPSKPWKPWGATGAQWDPAKWDNEAISAQARRITGFIRKHAVAKLDKAFVLPGADRHYGCGGKLGKTKKPSSQYRTL